MNFHNLDVYNCALDFLTLVQTFLQTIGRGEGELKDQLRRAALSIPLNIAEASGKVTQADRARFYAIARGSANKD
jgi:four helix bundle protein